MTVPKKQYLLETRGRRPGLEQHGIGVGEMGERFPTRVHTVGYVYALDRASIILISSSRYSISLAGDED